MAKIKYIHAREILDSRGNPTVEVDVVLDDNSLGRAAVPSGASTGVHEALELRDNDKDHYQGKGVRKAVENVNEELDQALTKAGELDQAELDRLMIEIDGTDTKSRLGANAILGVSLAFAWAQAKRQNRPLFKYIGDLYGNTNYVLPRPMFNIMNGGAHANWSTDIQEYMVIPQKYKTFAEALEMGSEIFHSLEKILDEKGKSTNVGNEGGFAPDLESNTEAFDLVASAITKAGYKLGDQVDMGLDVAASEFWIANKDPENDDVYELKSEGRKLKLTEWLAQLKEWLYKYPIVSIEDPLGEDAWQSWEEFLNDEKNKLEQVVGDDLLVTNVERIKKAISLKACNALLVKVNQIGTLTETLAAMRMSTDAGWKNIVSHRSGETEDVTIAHLVVGTGAGQIKSGAPSRGERTAKYNELLRISELI